MKPLTRRAAVTALAILMAGAHGLARADEAPKLFHGVGVITDVDAASGALTIDHGDIPGLMDAMEMTYKVRPASLANGLKKGDTVAFGLDGKTYTILQIAKVTKP